MNKIEKFVGEYAFLSNFYPCKVKVDNIVFDNAEAAFQSRRTTSEQQRRFFQHMLPSEARRSGAKLTQRPDWDQIKVEEMRTVLRAKFAVDDLKTKLLATNDAVIVNTDSDLFWGVNDDKGENQLGKLLMTLRDEMSSNGQKHAENEQTPTDQQPTPSDVILDVQDDDNDIKENDDAQTDTQDDGKKKKKHKK